MGIKLGESVCRLSADSFYPEKVCCLAFVHFYQPPAQTDWRKTDTLSFWPEKSSTSQMDHRLINSTRLEWSPVRQEICGMSTCNMIILLSISLKKSWSNLTIPGKFFWRCFVSEGGGLFFFYRNALSAGVRARCTYGRSPRRWSEKWQNSGTGRDTFLPKVLIFPSGGHRS